MNGREKYIASKAYKRPVGSFTQRDNVRDFARSGHGQNYHKMMDLHQQLPTMTKDDPRVQEFKDRRRSFNRYGKYPMGEMLGMSPLDMQKKYVGLSRDVRQTNKPVYNKMYPIEGGYMDYTQGGGLPGLILKGAKSLVGNIVGMGRDILGGDGINGADRDVSQKELDDYAAKTFGFYPSDVHPGLPIEDETFGLPPSGAVDVTGDPTTALLPSYMREDEGIFGDIPVTEGLPPTGKELNPRIPDWSLDLNKDREMTTTETDLATDTRPWLREEIEDPLLVEDKNFFDDEPVVGPDEPLPFDEGKEDFIRRQNEYVSPLPLGSADPQGDFDSFNEYADNESGLEVTVPLQMQEPLPFDDSGREEGIASMMKSGLNLAGRRPYEDVYREFVESSGPSKVMVTYEDFMENYLPRIQESRGVFRAGLNSQGRR